MNSNPSCSVIVLNWNGRQFLGPCLESLRRQTFQDFEIILVDNASTDGSAEWVAQHYPEVRLLVNERNLGFTGGNNVGFAAARGELVVLLNNDTEAEPHFLEALVQVARSDPKVGMVAAVLVFAHQPTYVASAGIRMQWDGVGLDYLPGRPLQDLPAEPVEIFGPSGGAALYRRAMLEQIGFFWPTYFIYLEDVDLAWRGQLAGWRCLLAPQAVVRHVYSATMGQGSPFKSFLLARNRWLMLFLNLPAGLWLRWAPFILVYELTSCAYGLLARNWQVLRGRMVALKMLPGLWSRRRAMQRMRCVSLRSLSPLLSPPLAPWTTLRLRRQIDQLIQSTE
jgi:GT2 family glycosyltransferase